MYESCKVKCFSLPTVHKKPLKEIEIAAICHDALQVSINPSLLPQIFLTFHLGEIEKVSSTMASEALLSIVHLKGYT